MSKFLIIDERRYPLEVSKYTNKDMSPIYRWEHRATIATEGKRFLVFIDQLTMQGYIEDVTTGELKKVKDEELWDEMKEWTTSLGFFNPMPPLFKSDSERFI